MWRWPCCGMRGLQIMIRPIIATKNPYDAAADFQKCGWNIDFMTPADGDDPLAGVSLWGNKLLLGVMDEKYVDRDAVPYIGAGVEFHIVIPADKIQEVYENHSVLSPTKLEKQPWGEVGFKFKIQGYKFMILAQI